MTYHPKGFDCLYNLVAADLVPNKVLPPPPEIENLSLTFQYDWPGGGFRIDGLGAVLFDVNEEIAASYVMVPSKVEVMLQEWENLAQRHQNSEVRRIINLLLQRKYHEL